MTHTLGTVTALGAATLLTAGLASAAAAGEPSGTRAPVTVTIKAEGTDLSGKVSSPDDACAAERKVVVFKQKGTRGGGDDKKFASDITDLQGDDWVWSTGNTGTEGRFYAKVRRTEDCRRDTSRTVRAERDD